MGNNQIVATESRKQKQIGKKRIDKCCTVFVRKWL